MAVAADRRGRGIGAAMLSEASALGPPGRRRQGRALGLSRERAAQVLYRRFGFVEEGRLRRHSRKSYGDEDEILMGVWIGEDG